MRGSYQYSCSYNLGSGAADAALGNALEACVGGGADAFVFFAGRTTTMRLVGLTMPFASGPSVAVLRFSAVRLRGSPDSCNEGADWLVMW